MYSIDQYLTEIGQLQINTLVPTIVGVITIVGALLYKFPVKLWEWLVKAWGYLFRRNEHRPGPPSKTFTIVFNEPDSWWSLGKVGKLPAMQVVLRCYLTNVTDIPVIVLAGYLKKPRVHGQFWMSTNNHRGRSGGVIPPKATVEFSGTFWIQPPKLKDGKTLKAALILVDQFDNRHVIKGLRIRGHAAEKKQVNPNIGESLHAITDPIEKKIVSVLKNECARYRECGRRVGGLGSVMTYQNGKSIIGVGTDSRPADSPHENSISFGEQTNIIRSENATALIELFGTLTDEEVRFKFISALENRLSKGSEYSSIGYFILLVLFRLGKLKVALAGSKKLEGDDEFGFSDFLRLSDGLLRYEQASFSEEDLDELEKCVDRTAEHAFRIKERTAAIRAYRLRRVAQR